MFKKYSEEKGKLVWKLWVILLVEFLGTFAMTLEIIAPSSFDLASNPVFAAIFSTNIMKAVWVASFILILIFVCRKVSVNLNPAVTMAEIAYGNTKVTTGVWMMLFQVMGGLLAGESAYLIANAIGTWSPVHSHNRLDTVVPSLNFKSFLNDAFHIRTPVQFDWLNHEPQGAGWLYGLFPMFMEFILTFALLASVCYGGDKIHKNKRAIIIFITLVIIVSIGIPTDTIALNPARLIGPAVATQLNNGAKTFKYTWIFFMGEMMAVIMFWYIENRKKERAGNSVDGVKKHLRVSYAELLCSRAKYDWVINGNKPLEQMNKSELVKTSKKLNIFDSSINSKDEIEYNILEHLIFGFEEKNDTSKVKAKKVQNIKKQNNKNIEENKKEVINQTSKNKNSKTTTKITTAKKSAVKKEIKKPLAKEKQVSKAKPVAKKQTTKTKTEIKKSSAKNPTSKINKSKPVVKKQTTKTKTETKKTAEKPTVKKQVSKTKPVAKKQTTKTKTEIKKTAEKPTVKKQVSKTKPVAKKQTTKTKTTKPVNKKSTKN